MEKSTRFQSVSFLFLLILGWGFFSTPAKAQSIQVTSSTPNSAAQGTSNLNVIVGGSGFKKGAQAAWFVTGTTNPGGVTVNSTAFNISGQLTANITVSDTADLSSYDIVVTNTDGRSGKGTKLFSVTSNGKNSTPCTQSNVTSVVYDTDASSVPLQIQSDGLGPFTAFSKGRGKATDTVVSDIGSGCMWTMDTTGSTSRGIMLTLAYPFASQPAPPFVGPQELHAVMHSHCTDNPNNTVDFGSMTFTGQTLSCPVNVAFYYNSVWYNFAMNPFNWPGTTSPQVTCTGASSGQCNSWTVLPDPATAVLNTATNQSSAVGELILPSCVGCAGGTPLGLYEVLFDILVHK